MEKEALFYEKQGAKIKCKLCPHNCLILNGDYGKCNVRRNKEGVLYTVNYVYLGNMAGTDNSTYCPKCNYKIIERGGYHVHVNTLDDICPKCGYKINIVI
jgi:hypothetical protein